MNITITLEVPALTAFFNFVRILMTLQEEIDVLRVALTSNTSVVGSAETLMDGLSAQIAKLQAVVAAGDTTAATAALAELVSTVQANKDGLALAVARNTRLDPTPTPVPTPVSTVVVDPAPVVTTTV